MPRSLLVVDSNPNDNAGGGGCACHPLGRAAETEGPFVVFPNSDTDQVYNPHVVVCSRCVHEGARAIDEDATLAGGEVVDTTAVEEAPDTAESVQADGTPRI